MAESAAGVEGCTSGTRDCEKVDATESAAGRGGDQPAGAERSDHSGWRRMAGSFSYRKGRQRALEGGSAVASRRCWHRRADAHAQGREGRRENLAVPIAAVSHLPPLMVTIVAVSMSAGANERGVRPLKWSGPPALCRTTEAGGRAMTTRRRAHHERRRGWRRGGGHVGVLVGVLAGNKRGRRAPGTIMSALRAPPP